MNKNIIYWKIQLLLEPFEEKLLKLAKTVIMIVKKQEKRLTIAKFVEKSCLKDEKTE